MKVDLVIPTLNAEPFLAAIFENLRSQSLKLNQIIVIDSASNDRTQEIAKENGAKVISINRSQFDHGGTRKQACNLSKAEVIIFMTQDCLPWGPDSLEKLVKPFSNDKAVANTYGRQLPIKGASFFGAHLRAFNYGPQSSCRSKDDFAKFGIKTAFTSNSFAAYRRKYLNDIGGFRSRLIMGEDTIAAFDLLLAGHKVCYVAEAKALHSHDYTIAQEMRRYFDIGVFHSLEPRLLEMSGGASKEGLRFVVSEIKSLFKQGRGYLLPASFLRLAAKFLGYRLGLRHKSLPPRWQKKLSMHKGWWPK